MRLLQHRFIFGGMTLYVNFLNYFTFHLVAQTTDSHVAEEFTMCELISFHLSYVYDDMFP